MANLKEFRTRIESVRSTKKITAAMKMVSGARLRRAEESATKARPYAEQLRYILSYLLSRASDLRAPPALLTGRPDLNAVLLIVFASDRGLCGSFNAGIGRATQRVIQDYLQRGVHVRIICVGRKAADLLKNHIRADVALLDTITDGLRPERTLETAQALAARVIALFQAREVDEVHLLYNRFHSAIRSSFTNLRLIPVEDTFAPLEALPAIPLIEPSEEEVLQLLLERNMTLQIYQAALESFASEQGARMTAMDSATRNAEDILTQLTLHYNRTRQALITKELTEIVAGAEALGNR
ncbi:MAG: ATP synthase F1 subunit gamma [Holosporales bacterium]|jgi:F-type H+-transporting ATPase subunit gamma|nr:ATP synthase F1 subunit gamma [Holosporales bacterium]